MNIQNLLCYTCGKIVSQRKVKIMKKESIIGRNLCYFCKVKATQKTIDRNKSQKQKDICSRNMKKNNPMFKPEVRAKVASTTTGKKKNVEDYIIKKKDIKRETKEETSERMKKNNPMFRNDVKKRALKTFKERVKNGIIVHKRGQDHHLWKGNRDFSNYCRNALRPFWTIPIIIRDNRRCVICQSSHEIQVHHLKPFKFFTKKLKKKYGFKTLSEINSTDYDKYCNEIIGWHKLEDGITVCKKCHEKIDPQYRGGEYNKNKKRII